MDNCPQCQAQLNNYPAGVSKKSGKAYSARVACSNPDCNYVKWAPREKTPQKATGSPANGIVEVIYRLDAMKEQLERIENIAADRQIQKKYGSQEPKKAVFVDPNDELQLASRKNTVDGEFVEDIDVKDIPF